MKKAATTGFQKPRLGGLLARSLPLEATLNESVNDNPVVIYKGKSGQQQWFPKAMSPYKGWHFAPSDKGWTTDEIALEWLKKKFIPETRPEDPKSTPPVYSRWPPFPHNARIHVAGLYQQDSVIISACALLPRPPTFGPWCILSVEAAVPLPSRGTAD